MTPEGRYSGTVQRPAEVTGATVERGDRSMLERRRERSAERERRRLVSDRSRRLHAKWLRRIARRANDPGPIRRRREALLHYRAAAVRGDLLELAAMLERVQEPDPACMAALHDLLANAHDSALYNANIPVDELRATIVRVRAGVTGRPHTHTVHGSASREDTR